MLLFNDGTYAYVNDVERLHTVGTPHILVTLSPIGLASKVHWFGSNEGQNKCFLNSYLDHFTSHVGQVGVEKREEEKQIPDIEFWF